MRVCRSERLERAGGAVEVDVTVDEVVVALGVVFGHRRRRLDAPLESVHTRASVEHHRPLTAPRLAAARHQHPGRGPGRAGGVVVQLQAVAVLYDTAVDTCAGRDSNVRCCVLLCLYSCPFCILDRISDVF